MHGIIVIALALGTVSSEHPRRFIFPFGGGGGGGGGGGSVPSGFGGSVSGSGTYRACVPSQQYCNLQCNGGYMKGPTGCDFCMCSTNHVAATSPPGLTKQTFKIQTSTESLTPPLPDPTTSTIRTTTAGPTTSIAPITSNAPITSVAPTTSRTVTLSGTADKCAVAATLCTERCPEGYLTDPTDCTFCVCKSMITG